MLRCLDGVQVARFPNLASWAVVGMTAACLGAYIAAVAALGTPKDVFVGSSSFANDSRGGLFVTGLIAGLVTFGGAYTAIPLLREAAVVVRYGPACAWEGGVGRLHAAMPGQVLSRAGFQLECCV
jgi:hypothetical protein